MMENRVKLQLVGKYPRSPTAHLHFAFFLLSLPWMNNVFQFFLFVGKSYERKIFVTLQKQSDETNAQMKKMEKNGKKIMLSLIQCKSNSIKQVKKINQDRS